MAVDDITNIKYDNQYHIKLFFVQLIYILFETEFIFLNGMQNLLSASA